MGEPSFAKVQAELSKAVDISRTNDFRTRGNRNRKLNRLAATLHRCGMLRICLKSERTDHAGAHEKTGAEIFLLKDNAMHRCRGAGLRMDKATGQ